MVLNDNSYHQEKSDTAWETAFEAQSEEAFSVCLSENVVLEAAAITKPIQGRKNVEITMATASKLYSSLAFTSRDMLENKIVLQWRAVIKNQINLTGVTILTTRDDGLIEKIGIYHSPLNELLEFSKEMGCRTKEALGENYFHRD
ncbi:nuclear transport factor 2 family protein [Serratia marcescens]|nr:nuclear transport factor 2 family protein [Serratia marcescens]